MIKLVVKTHTFKSGQPCLDIMKRAVGSLVESVDCVRTDVDIEDSINRPITKIIEEER